MTLLKSLLLITLFSISTVTEWAQEHQHREHLSEILAHYMNVKEALAKDNFEGAQSSLPEFKKGVVQNSEMANHPDHAKMHKAHHTAMVEAIAKGLKAEDISELRSAFKDISALLVKVLENQGYDGQTLYLQYCPMAVNDEGAYWISDQKKIVNPYLGQMMPGCGQVEKEINKSQ